MRMMTGRGTATSVLARGDIVNSFPSCDARHTADTTDRTDEMMKGVVVRAIER
jgi:hypothetical protein